MNAVSRVGSPLCLLAEQGTTSTRYQWYNGVDSKSISVDPRLHTAVAVNGVYYPTLYLKTDGLKTQHM